MQATAAPSGTDRRLTWLLVTVSCGGILAPLNSTMLAVALPSIRDAFDISHAALGWLVSSYLIAMAVGQPVGGRLGDSLGRARVFRWALWAFVAASLGAALAPAFWPLVVLRIAQALAGAAVIPTGLAMLRQEVPAHRLGRIFGLNGAAMSCAAAAGPLIGAALLAAGSWRALFLLNVPVVLIALVLGARFVAPDAPVATRRALDWIGAALFTVILVGVTVLLEGLRGGTASVLIAAGVVSLVALLLFARRLATVEAPTIEWRLFRERSFAAGTLHVLLTNLVMYTVLLMVPFFVNEVQRRGSTTSGLLLGAMSVLMTIIAPFAGRLSDAWGRRSLALAGSVVLFAGTLLLLLTISPDVSSSVIALALALIGIGIGIGVVAASTAAIESAPVALAGSASGTNSMMRYLGSIVGVGVLASVLTTQGGAPPTIAAFRVIVAFIAVIALVCIPVAACLHRLPPEISTP